MDVVGKGDYDFVIAVVPLQSYLGYAVVLFAGHIYYPVVKGVLVAVYIADEFPDAALIAHLVPLLHARALVLGGYVQAAVQKGLLAHTGVEDVVIVLCILKHLRVGLEAHHRAGVVGLTHNGHAFGYAAPGEFHAVHFAVPVDCHLQPLGKGVDNRSAHAVKTAGDLVAPAAELAAGVEHGVDHLKGGLAGLALNVHGDAAAVIGDADDVPGLYHNFDVAAISGQGLVYGVINNFIHQMVQSGGGGGADIHTRPLAHSLQSFQYLNLTCVVFLFDFIGYF